MSDYGRELAGWLATLEGGSPFGFNTLSRDVLAARAETLHTDLTNLAQKGITSGPGVDAARDLLALFERAGA